MLVSLITILMKRQSKHIRSHTYTETTQGYDGMESDRMNWRGGRGAWLMGEIVVERYTSLVSFENKYFKIKYSWRLQYFFQNWGSTLLTVYVLLM